MTEDFHEHLKKQEHEITNLRKELEETNKGLIALFSELDDANKRLGSTNKKLNLLNSITRHDILNQLTVLLGYLEITQMETKDPHLLEYIKREKNSALTIKRQIEFTKEYQDIGVNTAIWQNVKDTFIKAFSLLDIMGISIDIKLDGLFIYADPLLEKVFYNFIDNSKRHGENVTEICSSYIVKNSELILIYEDNGVGIPTQEKEKVFELGFGKNTGFGMFIAGDILAMTGLSVKETGIPGAGARFEILVPKSAYKFG